MVTCHRGLNARSMGSQCLGREYLRHRREGRHINQGYFLAALFKCSHDGRCYLEQAEQDREDRPVLLGKSWSVWFLVQPALKDAVKGLDSVQICIQKGPYHQN